MPSTFTSSSTSTVGVTGSLTLDALISGSKWGGAAGTGVILSYSFPWASGDAWFAPNYSSDDEPDATLHYALNPGEQAAARGALQAWANVANIQFQEVADTQTNVGDLRFGWTSASGLTSDGAQAWGWAYYPGSFAASGDVWIIDDSSGNTDTDWSAGSYNYESLIHEIGHALGLKHSFEDGVVLPPSEDSAQYTVMSYTEHPDSWFVSGGGGFHVEPDTPMLYDIAAIQYLYGANMSCRTGNDTYTFDPDTPFYRTIWDAGGNDTLSVSNFSKGCTIDLTPGHFSTLSMGSDDSFSTSYDGTDNLAIAYNCIIENAIGGSGNDVLIGNSADNRLVGGAGSDTLVGDTGNDALDGGSGMDTALFSGNLAQYTRTTIGGAYAVRDNSGSDGVDTLTHVERLQFADGNVALDVANGPAGTTAKILGVVFGPPSVANKTFAGIGLALLDGGVSYSDLMMGALTAKLGGHFSNAAEVDLLYQNLFGHGPTSTETTFWSQAIDAGQFSLASLAIAAAELGINASNIDLVGLTQAGLAYLPQS